LDVGKEEILIFAAQNTSENGKHLVE
jgi:hypothetical protein